MRSPRCDGFLGNGRPSPLSRFTIPGLMMSWQGREMTRFSSVGMLTVQPHRAWRGEAKGSRQPQTSGLSASCKADAVQQPSLVQPEHVEADYTLCVRACVCVFREQHSHWGLFSATVAFLLANESAGIVRARKYLVGLSNQLA